MLAGTLLSTLSLIMASISKNYAEFVATQGVLFGLGSALVYDRLELSHQVNTRTNQYGRFYPSIASVSTHYSKYKATAIGIALAGTSIGEK